MFRDDEALERECIEIELDLIRLRLEVEKLRYELKTYDPNQLRVPKGQPEGGQWTKIGGGASAGPGSRLKDGPDGSEETQGGGRRRRSGDRHDDFYLNSHIRNDHIALTEPELVERVRRSTFRGPFLMAGRDRHGSFESEESARDLIRRTLDNNPDAVERVREGRSNREFLTWRFGFVTGREAVMEPVGSPIRLRNTYEVGVVIHHDAAEGYRIISAYPRNFNPRIGR